MAYSKVERFDEIFPGVLTSGFSRIYAYQDVSYPDVSCPDDWYPDFSYPGCFVTRMFRTRIFRTLYQFLKNKLITLFKNLVDIKLFELGI